MNDAEQSEESTARTEVGLNRSLAGGSPGPDAKAADTVQNEKTLIGAEPAAAGGGVYVSVGDKIGKYEIRQRLGEGGMGAVYLAFDPLIEREVALKVLTPEVANSPTALQRFLGEARAIGRLNHPHVVSIYEIDQWQGQYYLVMELLSGGSVAQLSDERGALPWEEACRIVIEAARGLSAAHAAGMIHRDIKPENLMLTKDGAVKVVDFGLSKLLDAAHDPQKAVTKAGQILGTPQYMSPEQFEGQELDARTDIYSLGATLYRLLTARFPFHDSKTIVQVMSAHLTKPPPVATVHAPQTPTGCNEIIARSMAKAPADRYQTAKELADELEAILRPSSGTKQATDDRPLTAVLIVEPSKLQGAVLKDALSRHGVRGIQGVSTAAEAVQAAAHHAPDLLLTAMQLPDGQGIELIKTLGQRDGLRNMTVVVNSSDSTIEELLAAGSAACLMLAPKKVRPEEILRVVHAAAPCYVSSGSLAAPVDPAAARLRIVLESRRIPDALAAVIRDLQLLDVEVVAAGEAATGAEPPPVTLVLHSARSAPHDAAIYAPLVSSAAAESRLVAAVQVSGNDLSLRAIGKAGIVAVLERPLDARRLTRLLQAGRV